MEFKFVILCMASRTFATTLAAAFPQESVAENVEVDNEVAETQFLSGLTALAPSSSSSSSSDSLNYLNNFPYEGPRESIYGTFAAPQPTLGVSINTRALLAPQVEVLHLVEDFFTLSSDIIRRLNSKFHENYELLRVISNVIVKKVTGLQNLFAKGFGILRKILEFLLNLFNNYSITLPSITLGSTEIEGAPHATYGVPPHLNSTGSFR